ncbi:MAG TPA: trypsin-like peptidase domain-containing protein [Geminicoccaceae bacterium]
MRFDRTLALLGPLLISACQSEPAWQRDLAALKQDAAEVAAPEAPTGPEPVDWASLGDCRARLRHLLRLDAEDARLDPEHLPFALVVGAPVDRVRSAPPAVPVDIDLPIEVNPPSAASRPCVIKVSRPAGVDAAQRIVGQEAVASEYQSGTRREDNPAYELAKLRARQAERAFKEAGGDGWSEVGDPMLDLVGLLVGSVIGGFREAGSEREMNDALMELAKTPRKVDRPVWTAYHFERLVIDGRKQAELPVELIDRTGGPDVRTTIRQTERRRFYLPKGLHKRDRDYLRHRSQSIAREDLDAWQRAAPEVRVSQLAAALLEGGPDPGRSRPRASSRATVVSAGRPAPDDDALIAAWVETPSAPAFSTPGGGSAGRRSGFGHAGDGAAAEVEPLDVPEQAEAGLASSAFARRSILSRGRQAADIQDDPRFQSVVEVRSPAGAGSGFYVDRRMVVSNHHVVGEAGMVDVTAVDGTSVPGMVVAADVGRDLVLIHVPRAGPPVRLYGGPMLRPGQEVEAIGSPHGLDFSLTRGIVSGVRDQSSILAPGLQTVRYIQTDVVMAPGQSGGPLFLGDQVIGVSNWGDGGGRSGLNFAIHVDELRAFLEQDGASRFARR